MKNMDNKPQTTFDLPCFIFILFIFISIIAYKAEEFFRHPDAIQKIIDSLLGAGLCFGAAVLFILVGVSIETISQRIKGRFIVQSDYFAIRYIPTKMEKYNYGHHPPENLLEDPTQETSYPMLASMVITNYGIWIKDTESEGAANNQNTNWREYNKEKLDNSLIPIGRIVVYKTEGNSELVFNLSQSPYFKDGELNASKGDQLKLIIIFTGVMKKNGLKKNGLHEIIQLEQPIKLKLTVIDENGEDDLRATIRLYWLIYLKVKENEIEEDDSWMYHSRPIYW